MAVTYPLSLPTTKAPKRIALGMMQSAAIVSSPFTFAQQVQVYSGEMWTAGVTWPLMNRAEAEEYICFILALRGRVGTFYLGDPKGKTPRGTAAGSPNLDGAHSAGADVLNIKGFTATQTGALLIGDYIQLAGRMHKVVYENVDADGSGEAVANIRPGLLTDVSSGTALVTSNCKGVFRLKDNSNTLMDISGAGLYDVNFSCVEAIS